MLHNFWQAYVVTGFLTAISTLAIGLFVYAKKTSAPTHKAFLLLALAIFQWSFCTALQGMQEDISKALFWGRVCHIGVLFIPVFFYYFALKITGRPNDGLLNGGFVVGGVLCAAMLFTPYFIPTERQDAGVHFIASAGPLYGVIIVFFVFFIAVSLKIFFSAIRESTGARKKHLQYFFWASVMGYGIGVINFFPTYGILIPPYPYSAACGAVYFWILGYAVLKHKLFDIEVAIKKSFVFALLFLTIYGVVAGVIYTISLFALKGAERWMPSFSIALAMLIYEPLKSFLEEQTHRFLFRKKRRTVEIMGALSRGLRSNEGVGRLRYAPMISLIVLEMELKSCAYYELTGDQFVLMAKQGGAAEPFLDAGHPFHGFLREHQHPKVIDPLSLDSQTFLEKEMIRLDAEVLIPIKSQTECFGLLLLGSKKSEDEYNAEDEGVLRVLQSELEMQLLSAKLLSDAVKSGLELSQRSKMSALRHLARGVHHEVRNPLHTMSLYASTTIDEIHRGYSRRCSDDQWRMEVSDRVRSMSQEAERVRETLSRFAQFARPGGERPKTLFLDEEVQKFLALMREGQKLDNIDVNVNIPSSLKVLATENLIQEALFSLFMNALEAMNNSGCIQIEASQGAEDYVCVSVKDSGPGIPPHLLNKIFDADFTMKVNPEDAVFSLSAIKHRVELIGGRVEVKSIVGQGAEFILHFKPAL